MRRIICINEDWKFQRKPDEPELTINLPHTWNAEDGQDGGNDYYRGTCIYRKTLMKSDIPAGGKAYLEFRGVNSSAEVKVNDMVLGHHDGGYSTFRVNITDALKEENEIEVAVDNSPNDRVYPQRADFTFYGGIYRDVYLVTVPESHFDLDYYGSPGIQVTPEIKGKDAVVKVTTLVKGNYDAVRVTIDGVGTVETAKGDKRVETVLTIPNVRLWNGLKDPYLYHAKAELLVNGQVVDEVSTRFGCRTYSFDTEKGFILNGEPYPLRGVSRHQDRKGVGNALTKEMHEEDIEMILDIGANTVRLAHYQHDQYFYDLCDEKGLIVWAEIPYITVHMPNGRENTISQMTELIVQNYNHPSIICWGLSNETTLAGVTDDLIENHRLLNNLAHKLDKTRMTTMANLFLLETDSSLLDIPDLVSYNLYYGWYVGEVEDNDAFFDEFHEKYPDKLIGLSEYGADAYHKLQSPNPEKGDYSEQYQCVYHEHMLEMISKRPYLWSTYVWNMFDFGSDAREEAGDNGINHKGLVSFDRTVKKDAYYLYKAWWSKDPFVHLCGRRYVDRTEDVTEVKVYSNLNKVTLYKDGVLVEEKEGSRVFVFNVPIDGEHTFEARSGIYKDTIEVHKVSKPNPSYRIKEATIHNWFDKEGMEIIPGYFSIKDKIGDIKQVPEGRKLIDTIIEQMAASMGDMAKDVEVSDSMKAIVDRYSVENLINQAGAAITPDIVVMINKQLNKIKKPE